MKKATILFICVLCLWGSAYAQSTRMEQITLSELKQQMPDRLQMTVTTNDNRTVEIDAPIYVPAADTMPVVLVQRAMFDTTGLHDVYPFPDFYSQEYSKGELKSMLEDDHPGVVGLQLYAEEKNHRLSGRVDITGRDIMPLGATPSDNDVTPEEIMAFIAENVERFHCDTEPDFRVIKANALTGLYQMKRIKTPDGWTEYAIDEKQPVKNAGKGAWGLELAQYMHGVRILDNYLPYGSYLTPENTQYWYSPIHLYVNYLDEKNFNIVIMAVKEIQILNDDAPLLSYDALVQALQNRIREGKLKSVYQLTLGYSVKLVKGDVFFSDNMKDNYFNLDARFVLVPEWEILGFDEKNERDAQSVGLEEPTRDMVLQPECYSRYGLTYDVRMDAATGKFIVDSDAMEYELAR